MAPPGRIAHLPAFLAASLARRASDTSKCDPGNSSINLCEKPADSSSLTWLIVAVALIVLAVGTVSALVFLHLRRVRRDRREALSPQELEEYGIETPPAGARPKRSSRKTPEQQERHLSANSSADSMQSLARSLRSKDDLFASSAEALGTYEDELARSPDQKPPQRQPPQPQMQQKGGFLMPPPMAQR